MGAIALVSAVAALTLWPAQESDTLEHIHAAMDHSHLHCHDEHHQHQHEGWEGPEPHSHPHQHASMKHRHRLVIDEHHPDWPARER
jgi:hypothetical protein